MTTEEKKDAPQPSRARHTRLREIEVEMQAKWAAAPQDYQNFDAPEDYSNMTVEEKNASKYFATFPYPYMNGYLHLGHAFSMSKAEFQVRYQRQRGRRAILPQGFHCTGMPIQASANRLRAEITNGKTRSEQPKIEEVKAPVVEEKKEEAVPKGGKKGKAAGGKKEKAPVVKRVPPTQYEILLQVGIPESDIPAFQEAKHWLEFFPPKGKEDMISFGCGVDWRRSFITTSANPFYDSFIRWQFETLKDLGKIIYGKKYTIFSALDNQPCADHDRSQGEGAGPQEYVGIKIKLLEFPDSLSGFSDKNVYLVAATLRAETMYGQTNCFVLPEAEYGLYEMQKDEYFVISERAARNFAYQDLTKEYGKYPKLATVTGQDLIGKPLKAPLSHYEKVYALPMSSISMTKGTGIVTSVPSDSPDDWATLRDLQKKPDFYKVKEEWCVPFAPVPIINIPEFGDLSAVKLVEDLKISSQKDKDLLKQAKDMAYLKGFYHGKMLVGICKGEGVEQAKPKVKQHLLDEGLAVPYYEPESEIISRTGDVCIVASCYQWFMKYGEDEWKEYVRKHLLSDNFQAYNTKTQHEFDLIIDWLKEWGCTRTQGLGTKLPWDQDFVIESLSDSTIYMAYYTVAGLLQGGVMDGSELGPLGIKAEDLTRECWNFIFKNGPYPENCAIPQESLAKLRNEFNYWYPMDMRCSGRDLIRNHLTMSLYNHAAIWDESMMTRSYFCNGWMIINGEKMSKSTGNFLTLRDCVDKFGVDATRITLADAGDGLDDANFETDVANASILKLFTLEKWIQDNIKLAIPDGQIDFAPHKTGDLWDTIFENAINTAIDKATASYDGMKFKDVMKYGFYELQSIKEDYLIAKGKKANPYTLMRFIVAQLTMLNPIIPHFAQYMWDHFVYPVLSKSQNFDAVHENLTKQVWPTRSAPHDSVAADRLAYLKDAKGAIREGLAKAQSGGKKKPKKGAEAEPPKVIENCTIFLAKEYPEFQKQCLTILQGFEFNEENVIQGEYIKAIGAAFDKKQAGIAMKFVSFQLNIAKTAGKEAALRLEASFDEQECIEGNKAFLFENMPAIKNVTVLQNTSEAAQAVEGSQQSRDNACPSKPAIFYN